MDMTRRGFLAGGAALGGLMASSALPVLADDPSLFPGRGRFERLSLNYHEIKAGASKPFTVLHISDTHLTAAYPDEGEWERKIAERRIRTFGGLQEEALRDSIAWAKLHTDYIVHTGDLIDFQSRANFDLVKKYYGEGGAAMLGCLKDGTTQDFVAYLRAQPLLKGILCGHGHIGVVSPFSPTAKQYEVAGDFMFHAQEFMVL